MELTLEEKIKILLVRVRELNRLRKETMFLDDISSEIRKIDLAWSEIKAILMLRPPRSKK